VSEPEKPRSPFRTAEFWLWYLKAAGLGIFAYAVLWEWRLAIDAWTH
jgi:hypothetical protein